MTPMSQKVKEKIYKKWLKIRFMTPFLYVKRKKKILEYFLEENKTKIVYKVILLGFLNVKIHKNTMTLKNGRKMQTTKKKLKNIIEFVQHLVKVK